MTWNFTHLRPPPTSYFKPSQVHVLNLSSNCGSNDAHTPQWRDIHPRKKANKFLRYSGLVDRNNTSSSRLDYCGHSRDAHKAIVSGWIPFEKHCYIIFVAHFDPREHFDSAGWNALSAVHSGGDIWRHCTCLSLVDWRRWGLMYVYVWERRDTT